MKKVLLVLFMVLFAATLWSESVTEAAKKEKARREDIAKQGKKAKVLTNKDVSTLKSSLGIESTGPTGARKGLPNGPRAGLSREYCCSCWRARGGCFLKK